MKSTPARKFAALAKPRSRRRRSFRSYAWLSLVSCFLVSGSFFYNHSANIEDIPQFIKDIKTPDLNFTPPVVTKLPLTKGKLYALKEDLTPMVWVDLYFAGGRMLETSQNIGLYEMMASVLRQSGGKAWQKFKLEEALERIGARMSIGAGYESVYVEMSFRRQDLKQVMKILKDLLKRPAYDEQILANTKKRTVAAIKRRNDNPSALASRKLREIMFHGGIAGLSESIASVQSANLSALQQAHSRVFRAGNMDAVASGDIDPKALREELLQLEAYLPPITEDIKSTVKKRTREEALASPYYSPGGGRNYFFINRPISQSTILIGSFAYRHNHPRYIPAKVANYVLGEGSFNSKLFRIIRSDRGLAYSTYSYIRPGRDYGDFRAFAQTKTESTREVIELFDSIFKDYAQTGPTNGELQWARNTIVNKFIFLYEDAHDIATQEYTMDEKAMPENYLKTFRSKVLATSNQDVTAAIKDILSSRKQIVVVVGDKTKLQEQLSSYNMTELQAD